MSKRLVNNTLQLIAITVLCYAIPVTSEEIKTTRPPAESGLVGVVYQANDNNPKSPLIYFTGAVGGFVDNPAAFKDFTDMGFAVFSLAYFDYSGESPLPNQLQDVPLEYFRSAMNWVATQENVVGDSYAVYGDSRGSEATLLLASVYHDIDIVIASVPSAYVWGQESQTPELTARHHFLNPCGSAWSYNGLDIPAICNADIAKLTPWYAILDTPDKIKQYIIPVEKSTASIFFLSGDNDPIWPSKLMADRLMQRLDSAGYDKPYQHISYTTGHDVFKSGRQDILTFLRNHSSVMTRKQPAHPPNKYKYSSHQK